MSHVAAAKKDSTIRLTLGTVGALALLAFAALGAVLAPYTVRRTTSFTVLVEHPGIEAGEIERSITLLLENAAAGLDGATEIMSNSSDGTALVQLRYRRGHDLEAAYVALREMVEAVTPRLPAGSRRPRLLRGGGNEVHSPVFIAAVPGPSLPHQGADQPDGPGALSDVQLSNDELRSRYAAVDQVALVEVAGREPEEILIRYRASDIDTNGLFGASGITQRLREFSGALAVKLHNGMSLIVGQRYDSASAVANTPLGDLHTIGGVTNVRTLPRRAERVTQLNGSPGAIVYVMASADANLIRLSSELRDVGRGLDSEATPGALPHRRSAEPLVLHDLGRELRSTLLSLIAQVLAGAGAVVLLMVFLLRTGRHTWVVLPAVALACLTPAALLSWLGITLDAPALGAVALAAGLAADGSAVVLEFELQDTGRGGSGMLYTEHKRPYTTALLFSFFSTVVVFLPLYYAEPAFRDAYGSFAIALCSGLGAATLYTICVMPRLLCGRHVVHQHPGARGRGLWISTALLTLESRVRRYRRVVFLLLAVILAGAGVRIATLEYRTEAQVDLGATTAIVEFAAGTTVSTVVDRAAEYEARLLPVVGAGIELLTRAEDARLRMDFIGAREKLSTRVKMVMETERRAGETLYFPGEIDSASGFEVRVSGPERTVLQSLVHSAADLLGQEPGIDALYFRFREAAPVREIAALTPAMRSVGLSAPELASQIHHALGTGVAGKWYTHAGERDIRIQREPVPNTERDIESLQVLTPANGVIEVGSVATVRAVAGLEGRQRRNRVPTLGLTVLGSTLKAQQLRAVLSTLPRASGYFIDVVPMLPYAKPPFAVATAAVALVFLVLLIACNRVGVAAWAAAPAPLCFLLTLALLSLGRGQATVGLQSLLAAVIGLGISVNFSLLYLLTLPQVQSQAHEHEMPWIAATRKEAKVCVYRACVPATATTVAGVLPALLGLGGSVMLRPLSLGIFASAVVSLVLLPVWAGLFDPGQQTRRRV